MPKANPLAKAAKKLYSLQTKSDKLNSEITALAAFVAAEAKKASPTASSPTGKTPAKAKAPTRAAIKKVGLTKSK
jgi:hypothetical protein